MVVGIFVVLGCWNVILVLCIAAPFIVHGPSLDGADLRTDSFVQRISFRRCVVR